MATATIRRPLSLDRLGLARRAFGDRRRELVGVRTIGSDRILDRLQIVVVDARLDVVEELRDQRFRATVYRLVAADFVAEFEQRLIHLLPGSHRLLLLRGCGLLALGYGGLQVVLLPA